MFLFKYFIQSLKSTTSLFNLKDTKLIKVIVYFLMITIVFSFPMNIHLIENNGVELNTTQIMIKEKISNDYKDALPEDCFINQALFCDETVDYEIQAGELLLVFNPSDDYQVKDNSLIYYSDKIVFNNNGNSKEFNYENFNELIKFSRLKSLQNDDVTEKLISGLEGKFSREAIIFSLAFYTGSNVLMNTLFILIASLLAMLLKFGHNRFITYKETVKLFVFSTTWPTVIAIILGLLKLFPFMPVVFQFGTPLMFLLVYYRHIKFHY